MSHFQGGSAPRNPKTIGKRQVLQNFSSSNAVARNEYLSKSDNPVYVGLAMPTHRVEVDEKEKENKKEVSEMGEKGRKQIKSRKIEDGLLMVVVVRIYGKPVRALIDSSATRCFVTRVYVVTVGLKGEPHDTFLELGKWR